MKYNKVKEIIHIMTSKNGFPIYDLMQEVRPSDGNGGYVSGYIGATGKVFYTEDEAVLKQFRELDTLEEKITFLKSNPQYVKDFSSIPVMNDRVQLAFNHLNTKDAVQNTLKHKNYGCAYLVTDKSILVFYQGKIPHLYGQDVDLLDKRTFKNTSIKLLQEYEAGNIKEDGVIDGLAFEKVKNAISDYMVLTQIQATHPLKKEINTLIDFMNHFDIKLDINYKLDINDAEDINLVLNKEDGTIKDYKISKMSRGKMDVNGVSMNMKELLQDIHDSSKVVENKISQFLKNK